VNYLLPILVFLGITILLYMFKPTRKYIKWIGLLLGLIWTYIIYTNGNKNKDIKENINKIKNVDKNINNNNDKIVNNDKNINKINDEIKKVDENIKEIDDKIKEVDDNESKVDLTTEEADSIIGNIIDNNANNDNSKE